MTHNILKRITIFLAVLLLSFFLPWQLTCLLLIAVSLFVSAPVEYIFLVIGIFGAGIFSLLWVALCLAGIFIREKTRLYPSFL